MQRGAIDRSSAMNGRLCSITWLCFIAQVISQMIERNYRQFEEKFTTFGLRAAGRYGRS